MEELNAMSITFSGWESSHHHVSKQALLEEFRSAIAEYCLDEGWEDSSRYTDSQGGNDVSF
jgi:hypothetical protein